MLDTSTRVTCDTMAAVQIRCRQPLFDQMILNRYQPGEGLNPHTDLLRFKDGICVASLGSSAILKFTEPSLEAEHKVCRACRCATFARRQDLHLARVPGAQLSYRRERAFGAMQVLGTCAGFHGRRGSDLDARLSAVRLAARHTGRCRRHLGRRQTEGPVRAYVLDVSST